MLTCSRCNAPAKANQKFCNKCGFSFTAYPPVSSPDAGTGSAAGRQQSFSSRTMPPELLASVDIHQKKIAQDPLNASLYITFGDLYQGYQFDEDALIQYQKAVSIDSANFEGHVRSGNVYLGMKRLDRAADSFEKALRLTPDSPDAKKGLFVALKAMDRFDEAVSIGTQILEKEDRLSIHRDLKEIYLQQGKDEQALAELLVIVDAGPDKTAWKQLAELYLRRKDADGAFNAFAKVLDLDSGDKKALYHLGTALYGKGDWQGSFGYFERLLTLVDTDSGPRPSSSGPDNDKLSPQEITTARLYLCDAQLRLGRAGLGFASTIKRQDLKGYNPSQMELLANCLAAEGEFEMGAGKLDDAIRTFLMSLSAKEDSAVRKSLAEAYGMQGSLDIQKGNVNRGVENFNKGLEYDQNNVPLRNMLNSVQSKQKKKKITLSAIVAAVAVVILGGVGYLVWDNLLNPNTFAKKIDRALSAGHIYAPPIDNAMDIYRAKKAQTPDAKELKDAALRIRQKVEPIGEAALTRFYSDSDDSDWENTERIYNALNELAPEDRELSAKAEFCLAHKMINGRGARDYGGALSHYQKALQSKPNWVLAINGIAKVYVRKDSPFFNEMEAISFYTKACETDPRFPWAYTNIAAIHSNNKQFDMAEQQLLKAIAIKPDGASILRELGNVCEKQQRPWDAKRYYQDALKHEKNSEKLGWLQKRISSLP
jgi:tetratricopeptide (TPR) repeat protein